VADQWGMSVYACALTPAPGERSARRANVASLDATNRLEVCMDIQDAQRESRSVYIGGFWGQLVSSIIWLVFAALGTWVGGLALFVFAWIGRSIATGEASAASTH
jgi:hypothetical protein